MNAIESRIRFDYYNDLSRSARATFSEVNMSFNSAILEFIDDKFGNDMGDSPESFQASQTLRDDLYTLIKTTFPIVSNGAVVTTTYGSFIPSTFPIPADYYDLVSMNFIISSITGFVKPTTYNELGPLLQDSFDMPTNTQPYYVETATGFEVWRGSTGTITIGFKYIKTPATFSIGQESNIISPGGAVLTNGLSYIATEDSVQNATSYVAGTQFTAVGTSLTSGACILASLTTPIELPERTHDEICKRASSIFLKSIQMYDSAAAVESEQSKP